MKNINFIKTLSVKEQQALRSWSIFSLTMLGLVLGVIAVLQLPQLNMLGSMKKEYVELVQNLHAINIRLAQNDALKSRMCCLDGQCNTINTFACGTKIPHACMNGIMSACGSVVELHACKLQNKNFSLTAQCASAQQVTHFLKQLQKDVRFTNAQLVSLQPIHNKFVTFTIKGFIKE